MRPAPALGLSEVNNQISSRSNLARHPRAPRSLHPSLVAGKDRGASVIQNRTVYYAATNASRLADAFLAEIGFGTSLD
jgi:hypothetical protein